MLSDKQDAYILRVARDEVERQLYLHKAFYIGIRREWPRGTKILFVRRADYFIGSGIIDRIVELEDLEEDEKKMCLENNWYGKILFAKITRFHPPVPVQNTLFASQNPLTLHGAEITSTLVSEIESVTSSRIVI